MAQPITGCNSGASSAFVQARIPLDARRSGLLPGATARPMALGAAAAETRNGCDTMRIAAGASAAAALAACHSRRRGCRAASVLTVMATTEKVAAPKQEDTETDSSTDSTVAEQPPTKQEEGTTKPAERPKTGASASPADQLAQARAAAKARRARAAAEAAEGLQIPQKQEYSADFDVTAQPGVTAPLGYFDPLGFCPLNNEVKYRKLRTSELKHGRVAMLASVGLVVQHYVRFPGDAFDQVPSGVMAPFDPIVGVLGMGGFVFTCLVAEIIFNQDPRKEVGDFGDPFKVGMDSRDMKDRELNNGRFAMLATTGIIVAELVTGKDAVEQLTFWQTPAAASAAATAASGVA